MGIIATILAILSDAHALIEQLQRRMHQLENQLFGPSEDQRRKLRPLLINGRFEIANNLTQETRSGRGQWVKGTGWSSGIPRLDCAGP
jgi:hypothetical protein